MTRGDVTQLLLAWRDGDRNALEALLPAVYGELRQIAARYISRERPGHLLQPTALVHEAYLRLVDTTQVQWQNRAHFLAISAQVMRRVLVDHAREQLAEKRGGGVTLLPIDDAAAGSAPPRSLDVIAVDRALTRLAAVYPEQGRLVELRYFGGLTVEETAEVLGLSPATVKRHWTVARAWLYRDLDPEITP
jgi:RNA polymerase sigma factor (TIGR02999 family)